MLSQAAAIAETVPVYTLSVVRDLDRIEEVAGTIVGWHTSEPGRIAR
jgi:hypothetical protein